VSVFLKTLRAYQQPADKQPQQETPIWLMRQAGRYLPEYRALREHNSMLQMVRTPELACEVTLQPLRRFPLDAGIIFADILTPLIGMGAQLDFKKGEGPVIDNPVRTAADIEALRLPTPEENVGYTLEAIRMVVRELNGKTPLIGFCGAPFTLASYLIEGHSPGDLQHTKALMVGEPSLWHNLQSKLATLSADYLVAQVQAGCESLQIFDSWLGSVGPREYDQFIAPYLNQLVASVRSRVDVPLVFFATGVAGLFPRLAALDVDAFGVDWRLTLPQASALLGRSLPLQGNLDPQILTGPWEYVERSARAILEEAKELPAHVFNLGHGILPHTPVENVERLVALVKESHL
jgi:uroporphyrinogen decarboxylase